MTPLDAAPLRGVTVTRARRTAERLTGILTTILPAAQDVIRARVVPNRTEPRAPKWLPVIAIAVPTCPRTGDSLLMCARAGVGVDAVTVMENRAKLVTPDALSGPW